MTASPFHHDGLLTLARKACTAAGDADRALLAEDLATFVHALAGHLSHQLPQLTRLSPAEARLLRRGQARVSVTARALLAEAENGCKGPPGRCAARAEELLALLTLQARDERITLHRSRAGGGPQWRWSR